MRNNTRHSEGPGAWREGQWQTPARDVMHVQCEAFALQCEYHNKCTAPPASHVQGKSPNEGVWGGKVDVMSENPY